jgi:hypothetical protein
MFREKLSKDPTQRGYLYIRDSYYQRDKRTLKRKPAKLSNGLAQKNRGKYSKKKDIYCGKIQETKVKVIESFKQFIQKEQKDYLIYITNCEFEELIDKFVEYILYIYDIDQEEFYNQKKKAYTIGEGFCSKEIINWLKSFKLGPNYYSYSEIKRFYNRAQDCGIFDEDVINSLYLKLVPDVDREEIKKEIEELQKIKMQKENFNDLMGFLKK